MQANPSRRGATVHDPSDFGCREPFALGQEQELTVARSERREGLVHLPGERLFLALLDGPRLTVHLLVQLAAASVRPSLVRHHPSRGGVQPRSRRLAGGHVVEPPPGDQEHLGHRVLRIAARSQAPTAVRGDPGNMLSEQRLETFPRRVYLGHIDLFAVLRTHAVHVHTRDKCFSILAAALGLGRGLPSCALRGGLASGGALTHQGQRRNSADQHDSAADEQHIIEGADE